MVKVVRARIHPGIGIARLGDSDDYVLAPQVTTPAPRASGEMHKDGQLKREAVEFRVYGYDAAGNVVREVTAEMAEIDWHLHLAAKKASWYKFRAAMDLEGAADYALLRRNPDYDGDRTDLEIDPGPQTISGTDAARKPVSGAFVWNGTSTPVTIAELETDAKGRLRVLGGRGQSGSPAGLPPYVKPDVEEDSFGNATGWYDEICDGPVTATVRVDGVEIDCVGAWAVTAPPNYAPDFVSWRTLLDLCEEVWIDAGMMEDAAEVSFARDVLPQLQRMSRLQWLNRGFLAFFGPDGPLNFDDPALIDKLARIHDGDIYGPLRRQIFNAFRPMEHEGSTPRSLPWIIGDAFGSLPDSDPRVNLPLWPRAARKMERWVEGEFVADWPAQEPPPQAIDDIALADQPGQLDRAALAFCLADAFHPGIELTWPIRHASIWEAPFRIGRRDDATPEPDYGPRLTTARALGPDGPLHWQAPGGLTRWMAVPWQVDTTGCRSGYGFTFDHDYDPYVPTFWPARVPNHVLSATAYVRLMDSTQPEAVRREAFYERTSWYHVIEAMAVPGTRLTFVQQIELMIAHFARMGVVERRDGPSDLPGVPNVVYVEAVPDRVDAGLAPPVVVAGTVMGQPTAADRAARRAGWQDDAQRQEFRAARMAHVLGRDGSKGD